MKIRNSMRKKLMITIFIGCLIPYTLGGIYLNSYIRNELYGTSIQNTDQTILLVNELINKSFILDFKQEINLLASLDSVKNAGNKIYKYTDFNEKTTVYMESETQKSISEYFKNIKASHSTMNFLFLGTEDGGYMEYPGFSTNKSYDPRKRPWYINTAVQEDVLISEPYITNVSNDIVISFTKKIVKGKDMVGVLGVAVELGELTDAINQIKIGETGYVMVLSHTGKFIVSPKHSDWILRTPEDLGLGVFGNLLETKKTTFETELDGKEKVINTMVSKESGLRIVTVSDKNEIIKKARSMSDIFAVIYFMTAVIISIVIFIISKRITRPMLDISSVINRMTDFDFNFDRSSNIRKYSKRSDEIGAVSTALIDMHDNYSELMTQVNAFNLEINRIDIEKDNHFKMGVSINNPFNSVISSMNALLNKIYQYFEQLKEINKEIISKNELLTASEEELIAQVNEIEEQKEYINFLAFHDPLTGLPNRRKFIETAKDKLINSGGGAIILLDIDDFKGINDTLGHVFGDRVLEVLAVRLKNINDPKIFISRFGGDEFLILVECPDNFTALNYYIEKISNVCLEKVQVDDVDIELRFSMGVSLFPGDSIVVDQLIVNADLAMYEAKASGKNGYRLFNSRMMDTQIKKSNIENILRDAIENDGFRLVYQPQVDLKSGQIYCYEALLRLKNYNTSPTDFIDVAEKNGSIIKIGRYVTQKVIEQLFIWKSDGMDIKPVAINFSANQIHDSGYISFLKGLLEQYDLDAEYIEIEITENIILENKQGTLTFLKQLNEMGIKIAIDDFGTGYSSLNYLTFLPIDIIKLDRSLNMKFLEINNVKVMDSLISLAHSLDLIVVGEGIESKEHVIRLNEAKCDYIQGYYFSKPLEENQIQAINNTVFTNF